MNSKDVLKEFLFDCEIKKFSRKTVKSYRNNIEAFLVFIQKEYSIGEIEEINHLHIKEYFSFLMKNSRKESYINGILKTLRAYYKYCVQEEYVLKNPCLKVPWQKEGKTIIKTFTNDEVKKMLDYYNFNDYLNARNKTLLAFLFDTGIRNLELCQLKNSNIKEAYILIKGKGNKERYVGISPMLKKFMIKYDRIKESYFYNKNLKVDNYFLSRNGLPLTDEAVQRVIREVGKAVGVNESIRCSPHTARHYFAQTQLKNGLDLYSLSRLLGHENIMITKRYLQGLQDKDIIEMSIKTSPLMNL